ncbi:MAG: CPBP family intramembrane metalloprotease [Anaerolineales bacterium]|nr:CPBP family intramembrane metalloprotease [Anaerolineales bacterium]
MPYLAVSLGVFWFRNAWATLLGFHFAILLSLALAGSKLPVKILFRSGHICWVVLSILLSGGVGISLYLFRFSFGITSDLPTQIESLGLNPSNWIAFIAYFSLVNPFLEEYFWRGVLGSPTKGPSISDFLYAGFHALVLTGSIPLVSMIYSLTVLVLAGWFWRQIAREDSGLLAPVLGHMAADFTILVVIYRMAL